MQLLAQRQARAAAHRRSSHIKCVTNSIRLGATGRGPARLVAGSRRPSVRVQAEATAVAVPASSPLSIGTIALRKAVAQAAYKGSNVFVTGGQGQLSIRIIRELLAAGFKVTAGVTDLDAATAAFAFFKRYELIDKTAAANLKLVPLSSLEGDEAAVKALPKRAKVIVVDGDVEGKGKTGAKEVQFALALAEAISASQVVLVSTQPGVPAAGGSGLFGGLFGGGPKPSTAAAASKPLDKLGRLEQQVADSGRPYAIVRAFGTDRTDDGAEPGSYLQIGTLGTVPTSAVASKAQIALVISEVLKAAGPTNGLVFEVSATPDEQLSAADAIGEIIAAAEGAAAEAAASAAEEAAKSAGPAVGLFGLGTMSVLRKATATAAPAEEVAPEPETPAEEPPKKAVGTGFFGFGAKKAVAVEQPAAKEEAPALGTLSARRAAAKLGKAVVQEVVVEEEEAPKKTGTGFFGFGSGKVAAKKVAAKEEPKEEEEVPEPPKKVGSGFFGFGTAKVAVKKEEPKEEEEVVPEPPKKVGSGFFGFGTAKVAVKKEQPKEEEEEVPEPPKKVGSGFFGFGTARVAVKKPAEEEEEAPAPKRPVRASSRNAPPPPPPAPSPKRSAPSTGTAIRSRAAPPPPEPAPPKRSPSARRVPEPAPEPPKRSASVRGRTPEPEPPKRAASAPPAPTRGTSSVSSRSSPAPASASSSRSAAPSGTSRTSTGTGTSRISTPPPSSTSTSSRSSSASRGSRAAPAPEPAPTYVPGTRGARLAAQKAQQQQEQQRRK
ncbi:hypothetical protein Vafri_8864 [Volvox africanus]|uniref:NAD(P)-binding domain-containing protein n=1 Tax=Volvox africanus TaxID=51714 RepID=A0A8J4EZE5_9CHLO|nr:hypothetical protein Vafri_8864 [Volvox africanus]